MNVLALKAELHYPLFAHGPADYRVFTAMHVALLGAPHGRPEQGLLLRADLGLPRLVGQP